MDKNKIDIKNISLFLFKNFRSSSIFLMLIFAINMILESFSIALLVPLVSLILSKDLQESTLNQMLIQKLDFDLSYFFSDTKIFILFFVLIFFLKMMIFLICIWYKEKYTLSINLSVIKKLYHRYLNINYTEFISFNSSTFLRKLHYDLNFFSVGILNFLNIIFETLVLIGILILVFLFSWKVSLSLLAVASFFLIVTNLLSKKKITNLANATLEYEKGKYQNFLESFNLIKEIKIFNNYDYFLKKNEKLSFGFFYNDFLVRFIRACPRIIIEFLIIFGFIIFLYFVIDKEDPKYILELLTILAAATIRVLPSLGRIINSAQSLRSAVPSVKNIMSDLNFAKNHIEKDKINISKTKISKITDGINFMNVTYGYANSKKPILEKFNFKFEMNKIIGIKGRTGSGKTTLVNLLCGLIDPTNGSIVIDGLDKNKILSSSFQNLIGYVPQNIYLMDNSLKDNILFGDERITDTEIKNVIDQTELKQFISSLPDGLNSSVGEKSSKISGGQNQRIGIARALLKKPQILILDEATNALDLKTENKILDNFLKMKNNMMIILISHDKNTLKICDKIINLSEGF